MLRSEEEQEADEKDERVQVAPNMGAGGSDPRLSWIRRKKQQKKGEEHES